MRRAEPVKVPLEEIRRTLEDRDRPRRVPAATQPRDEGGRELVDEATIQALREAPQEPVRVPLHEIRRTMYDLDRQHAEERAHRGEGNRPRKASEQQPRGPKVILPAKEVARTLSDLDRQHAEEMTRRRRVARARPQEAMELESEFRNANLRVPLKEVTRTLDDLERQHTQETARRRQGALLQTAMEPQLRDGKLRVPPEEIVRISDSLDRSKSGIFVVGVVIRGFDIR